MRKIITFFIICLLVFSLQVCAGASEDVYIDTLRIGLSYGSSAKATAAFLSESDVNILNAETLEYITTIPGGSGFTVTCADGMLSSAYFGVDTNIRIESDSIIKYNSTGYRGAFELVMNKGKITVINIVNIEDYLASLLGKEMSTTWPIEALKAQAVCARNFAVTTAGKHSSYGFDLCATQDCQVYGGVSSEADSTRAAVEATKGVMVTYNGKVVPLYYFSCDGGYTENSENVWVTALGYLRGKKDIHEDPQYAKNANWSVTYTKAEIERILNSKNMGVGELLDIRIDQMSENNGVIKLTFVGTNGEKTVTKTSTRTILSLKSQAYTIDKHYGTPVVGTEDVVVEQSVLTSEGIKEVTNPQFALTEDGVKEINYGQVDVYEEADFYESYTFNGHGWGHLVGMSQWGAYSMAKNGYTYKDILTFYYTDIVIEEVPVTEYEETVPVVIEPQEPVSQPVTEVSSETDNDTQWSDTGL